MEPDEELDSPWSMWRARRALAVIAASVLAIGIASFTYIRPSLAFGSASHPAVASAAVSPASYLLAGMDFVSPSTGWVVVEVGEGGDFAVLHTTDAGRHWARQLSGPTSGRSQYLRFFDSSHGVLALLGPRAIMYRTSDGGDSWQRQLLQEGGGYVLSAAFVDARDGWLLTQPLADPTAAAQLFRTNDGGVGWTALGAPASAGDAPYQVVFADRGRGWLYTRSAGAYAYTTRDSGDTWQRIALPTPPQGWPAPGGQFFVAAQPTQGSAVVVTVVNFAPLSGRSAGGSAIIGYPPLKVHSYDGGRYVIYTYATAADTTPNSIPWKVVGGPSAPYENPPPNQLRLTSLDGGATWSVSPLPGALVSTWLLGKGDAAMPATAFGATGYADAVHWWWIGSGLLYKSSDGGRTWSLSQAVDIPIQFAGSLQALDAGHAWLGGMISAEPVLFTTGDGGRHWMKVALPRLTL